jgi:hypothetical protein
VCEDHTPRIVICLPIVHAPPRPGALDVGCVSKVSESPVSCAGSGTQQALEGFDV